MKRIGIVFHPKLAAAREIAARLSRFLPTLNASLWLSSAWEEEKVKPQVPGTDLIISVGGDGTILRVARAIVSWEVPIIGINLGKLGFLTELGVEEAMAKLPDIVAGEGWIEKRAMAQAELLHRGKENPEVYTALNDVVVGRGSVCRVIYVKTRIDAELLTTYKADGVIVSTATGSTGYSLAAGGPVLYPQAEEMVLLPISAHLTLSYPLVLPSSAIIEMEVSTEHQAVLSIDGQLEFPLESGDEVSIRRSPHLARFLRIRPASSFCSLLERKLKGVVLSEGGKGKNQRYTPNA